MGLFCPLKAIGTGGCAQAQSPSAASGTKRSPLLLFTMNLLSPGPILARSETRFSGHAARERGERRRRHLLPVGRDDPTARGGRLPRRPAQAGIDGEEAPERAVPGVLSLRVAPEAPR